ncbi:MAG: acyltransferase [Cytophagales bacterium]|nr:acyltransferase [Cytophagales bacterium]
MNNPATGTPKKILYIENLRIVLSVLVVIVHVACTYGGPGGWSYTEEGADLRTVLPLTALNATSQSFFMGMFFLFGAYFTHLSFQKKGFWKFVKDRFFRLGIPLIITYFLISPFTSWIVWPVKHPEEANISFMELWLRGNRFGVGVMWFAEALIYFSILYIIARLVFPGLKDREKLNLPKIKSGHILMTSLLLGFITFLARFEFPLFSGGHGTNFNLGHFPQYIFLFALGIIAAGYKFDRIVSYRQARHWLWFSLGMIFIAFPLLFFIGGAQEGAIHAYFGGATWHALGFSVWEQTTGIAIMAALIGFFKAKWNHQRKSAKALSNSAYALYVFHPPVIVWVCIQFRDWEVLHLIKFLAVAPIALMASYSVALLVKRMPLLKHIF